GHAAKVEADIEEAIKRHGIRADWTARSLALHTQAVLQGAFILAKAKGDAAIAGDSVDHLRRYIDLLFRISPRKDQHHDHNEHVPRSFPRQQNQPENGGLERSP